MRIGVRTLAAVGLAVAVLAYVGWLNLQVAHLRREAARRVPFITAEDFDRAMTDLRGEFSRQVGGLKETLGRLPGGGVFRRIEGRRGPEAPAGSAQPPGLRSRPDGPLGGPTSPPGPAARPLPPAAPLVPPSRAAEARRNASERIVAHFRPGTLLGCEADGVPKDAVEFLRDRTGRLLSTAPCVWKVEDEFYPEEQGVLAPAPSRWKLAAGYSLSGGVDYGVAYELVRLEPWSLDGVALVQTRSIGAGVARKITANVTVGPALLYSIRDREWALWVVFAGRF